MSTHGHDRGLAIVVGLLVILGLVMIQSASGPVAAERAHDAFYFVKRQGFAVGVGVIGCVTLAILPHRWLRRYTWAVYGAVLVGLVAVFLPGIGVEVNGASRWVNLGFMNGQPSEFAKLAVILGVAWYLDRHEGRLNDWRIVLRTLLVPLPVMVLVMAEPDFGSTVILAGLTLLMLYLAGLPLPWLYGLGGLSVLMAGPAVMFASYRVRRIEGFLNPWEDAAGSGYQIIQSMVALHSGGLQGRGLGESLAKHHFLPEPWTDFIGAVLGEELGLLGILGLLCLYGLLVWRGLAIARRAQDLYGTLLASAITALLGGQAFFNLGVVMGMVPPKGLVLPFMSYGGSAVLMHLLAIGMLLNISANGRSVQAARPRFRRAVLSAPVVR